MQEQEQNLLYEKVLEILSTDGWVNSQSTSTQCPYTLISAFWYANSILKIKDKVWHDAFDHIREVIRNEYPERLRQIEGTIVSDFGGHKDTTYGDVVRMLQLAIAPTASPPEEEKPKAIKFREWF